MLPVLGFLWARWLAVRVRGAPRPRPAPAALIWAFLSLVLAFWLARNLPIGQALAP